MDVSFFENQPYNTQNSLQGEIRGEKNFWEVSQGKELGEEIGEIGGILENISVEEEKRKEVSKAHQAKRTKGSITLLS